MIFEKFCTPKKILETRGSKEEISSDCAEKVLSFLLLCFPVQKARGEMPYMVRSVG